MMRDDTTKQRPPKRRRMSKAVHRLTQKSIERLRQPGRYHDGNGLLLQITPTGSRSWLYRYQRDGRERMLGLGPMRLYSLKEARQLRDEAEKQLRADIDPIDARREKRIQRKLEAARAKTFSQVAEEFLKVYEGGWTNPVHRHQWRQTLSQYAYPVIGDLPVASIDTPEILKMLRPIWPKPTAQRLRNRVERVLDFAKASKYRSGDNPAAWGDGDLKRLLGGDPAPTNRHHAAMPYADVPAFLAELKAHDGVGLRALEVTILTALRTSEAIGATWSEIDFSKREWLIPADRMKGKKGKRKEHRVPLTARVIEILEALPREEGNPYVFIGAKPGAPLYRRTPFMLLQDLRPGLTVHGFRSSFSDWAHERTATASHVIEMALAHAVGSAVERAYRRGDLFDKRRGLMEAWEHFCLHPKAKGEVVPLFGSGPT